MSSDVDSFKRFFKARADLYAAFDAGLGRNIDVIKAEISPLPSIAALARAHTKTQIK